LLLAVGLTFLLGGNLPGQTVPHLGSNAAFEQVKSLAGTSEGTNSQKLHGTVVYEVGSGGSAVMERLQPASQSEMVTKYSEEGNRLVVTHYCSIGNQPTMQTGPVAAAAGT